MATAAANTSIFHPFTRLISELRDLIWHAALPDEVGPVLYFYKPGGWTPLSISPECVSPNLHLEYHHDVLDAVQVEMPLFFVNREARYIALAWMQKHNIKMRVYGPKYGQVQSPVFVRPFNPVHHALYITVDQWIGFNSEPYDQCSEPDMIKKNFCPHPAKVTSMVLPKALFQDKDHSFSLLDDPMVNTTPFSPLYQYFSDLKTKGMLFLKTQNSIPFGQYTI
jgi:hypothetical protein